MVKVQITCEIDDEYADLNHEMGVTEEGYQAIRNCLDEVGADDVDITLAP